jgi:hypothetical protein
MVFDVIIGRSKKDLEKFGREGTIFLGKQYIKMGQTTSLSNPVYLDVAGSHVVFIVGKRGSGKSYTMGAIAEGLAELPLDIRKNLSIILLDTMGIYWTMKYPNYQDAEMLKGWSFEPKGLDVKIFTPSGFYSRYKEEGIPTDFPFSLQPKEVSAEDWCSVFSFSINSREGVLLNNVINRLEGRFAAAGSAAEESYSMEDLISEVKKDRESDNITINIVVNELEKARGWGIFSGTGTPLKDLVVRGQITVLDVSPYATQASGWEIKSLVVGLICRTLFNQRMLARKTEEFHSVDSSLHYFSKKGLDDEEDPLVWIALDEAHELLPKDGKTTATDPLVAILREGRQPGISLILASQQPGKIHTDVMTQSDIVIAHRLTARLDVDALSQLTQSYMKQGLEREVDLLPRVTGSAVVFDDSNERIFPIQMRPRFTWHGGSSPFAIKEKKEDFLKKINF